MEITDQKVNVGKETSKLNDSNSGVKTQTQR